jgi:o-succinylbenzoate synthase
MQRLSPGMRPFRLQLAAPLASSQERFDVREGFLFSVRAGEAALGFGEAMPLPRFGTEERAACAAALSHAERALSGASLPRSFSEMESLLESIAALRTAKAARCAVEGALLDAWARAEGVPLSRLLSDAATSHIGIACLLTAEEGRALALQAREAAEDGYRTVKVKVGRRSVQEDVDRVSAIRGALPATSRIRVDANGAWSEAEAEDALSRMADLGLELCEEPLAPGSWEGLARLSKRVPVALAADESLHLPHALRWLLKRPLPMKCWVCKPMVLGGLLPALRLSREAAVAGISVVVSSSLDGPVARLGCAHLASALPNAEDSGLGLRFLVAEKEPPALAVREGRLTLPSSAGLGWAPA